MEHIDPLIHASAILLAAMFQSPGDRDLSDERVVDEMVEIAVSAAYRIEQTVLLTRMELQTKEN